MLYSTLDNFFHQFSAMYYWHLKVKFSIFSPFIFNCAVNMTKKGNKSLKRLYSHIFWPLLKGSLIFTLLLPRLHQVQGQEVCYYTYCSKNITIVEPGRFNW